MKNWEFCKRNLNSDNTAKRNTCEKVEELNFDKKFTEFFNQLPLNICQETILSKIKFEKDGGFHPDNVAMLTQNKLSKCWFTHKWGV